ncbi:hypothetical protein O1L68_43460 [Streptomyces lydicus]|nr:hypothetical protein [Streptomyces lydicus]
MPGPARSTEVLAMPYLPNDGTTSSIPYPRAGAVDHNPTTSPSARASIG